MEDSEMMMRLQDIFRTVFGDGGICLTPGTTAGDIRGWDSLANVTLAVEIEHEFKIRIKPAEMEAVRTVGDLITVIDRHLVTALS